MLKCIYCRKDKKRCSPKERKWPTRCNWCITSRYPCSEGYSPNEMRHLADEGVQNTTGKVVIRAPIAIIQDLDCVLYLLSGLLEYDDQASAHSPPTPPQDPDTVPSNIIEYEYPSSKPILDQNISKLWEIKSACRKSLSKALEAIRSEAEVAVEYYSAKGQFCEVYALTSALLDSPESYKTTAVHARNQQLEALHRLEVTSRTEKQCGRLFLVIKSSTLPPYLKPSSTRAISVGDIQSAQKHLSDLVTRLQFARRLFNRDYLGPDKLACFCYYKIDPLWHRALTLMEREEGVIETLAHYDIPANRVIQQRNLLNETGVHFALRHNLSAALGFLCSAMVTNQADYGTKRYTDIRGMDFLMAAILYNSFNELILKLPNWEIENSKCFLLGKEIIRSESNCVNAESINHLDLHQLAAVIGDLEVVHTLAERCPGLHFRILDPWSHLYKTSNACNIVLNGLFSNIDLGFFPPVALAAMCQNSHRPLISYLLDHSIQSVVDNEEVLWGLIILAFRLDQEEFLSPLSSLIQNLEAKDLANFTKIAIEATTPVMFKKWVKIAWDDRPDKTDLYKSPMETGLRRLPSDTLMPIFYWPYDWEHNSWYAEAWHRIMEAFRQRYRYHDAYAVERQEFRETLQEIRITTWQGVHCQCTKCIQGEREIQIASSLYYRL